MLRLGETQRLVVVKIADHGAYLAEDRDADKERVLLPIKQVPEGTRVGSEIEVFIYKDSKDRPIATVNRPLIRLGETAVLKVKEVTKIGAFLDWGLEKDLFLPFAEQTKRVREGDEVLAAVYLDKSGRIAATMNVYPYLSIAEGIKKDDRVTGTVYETSVRAKISSRLTAAFR